MKKRKKKKKAFKYPGAGEKEVGETTKKKESMTREVERQTNLAGGVTTRGSNKKCIVTRKQGQKKKSKEIERAFRGNWLEGLGGRLGGSRRKGAKTEEEDREIMGWISARAKGENLK